MLVLLLPFAVNQSPSACRAGAPGHAHALPAAAVSPLRHRAFAGAWDEDRKTQRLVKTTGLGTCEEKRDASDTIYLSKAPV